ncbi:MAG: dipeptide ABC transporter ATP-binding protein [Burkholderiales bacterium]|nr:dipeptide ABC transporter ATP-binding protein [Burkholderiales bacterium]
MTKISFTSEDDVVLDIRDLCVKFKTEEGLVTAVDGVTLQVKKGETVALVGESGSGKSVTSLSVMRLVETGGGIISKGFMTLRDSKGKLHDLINASKKELRALRGADMAMIFQEPMTSLNPVYTVKDQIGESLILHRGMSTQKAHEYVVDLLKLVRIPDPESVANRYPHQLSGGMRQRVMIAMALACKPSLLIADEPTTALDVTVQAQILGLIKKLQKEINMGVLFITHDMGVVAEVADRVCVMRYGKVVEEGSCFEVFANPTHPYTRSLLAAVPRIGSMNGTEMPKPFELVDAVTGNKVPPSCSEVSIPEDVILSVRHIYKRFPAKSTFFGRTTHQVYACEDVSFDLYRGETLAIVGESGCGKSTTGRSVLRLFDIDKGDIYFDNINVSKMSPKELKKYRRDVQMIFQDPFASLDPRLTVGFSIAEPLLIHNLCSPKEATKRVAQLMEQVGLSPIMANRYPHEFSGGQRQRICIARALALEPKVIVADESVAALDVSIRAQVINLLLELQKKLGLSYIFISHDMGVVERISHRVAVMYLGQIVEMGTRRQIFENPQHPYTKKLLASVPKPDPTLRTTDRPIVVSDLPSPIRAVDDPPETAPLFEIDPGHFIARHQVGVDF